MPRGAFLFKVEGVIPSILLFMLFTIPLIIYHFGFETQALPQKATTKPTATKKKDETNRAWEEASIEDLESDEFEII